MLPLPTSRAWTIAVPTSVSALIVAPNAWLSAVSAVAVSVELQVRAEPPAAP
jgi:hypothetical protein